MRPLLIAFAALIVSSPLTAQSVEVADGNWSNIPQISAKDGYRMSTRAIDAIHEALATGTCKIAGQSETDIDLSVPFLVKYGEGGAAERIVVKRLGCERVESILGTVVLQLVKEGQLRPTGENDVGWYRSEISFSSRG